MIAKKEKPYTATRNACKLCTPLGASLVFKGVRKAVPLLHGSQGCSTYIRRYLISHFKEPVDIACSNFGEQTAIFGGGTNLKVALKNITRQYTPELIGIATTCLAETIGDDVPMFLREYRELYPGEDIPPLVHVSTPSYQGTHMDGFHNAVRAITDTLAIEGSTGEGINLFPGMLSPEDLRYLKEVVSDFDLPSVMLPDYSESLDGGLWAEYQRIPEGGTPVDDIRTMGSAAATVEFGRILSKNESAGKSLRTRLNVPCFSLGLPIGVNETDAFFKAMEKISGIPAPEKHQAERGRLLDAYVDGHKYVSDLKAVVYGEEDLVVGLASFLSEIGITPVLCASGGQSGHLKAALTDVLTDISPDEICIRDNMDFIEIEEIARDLKPNFIIGNSKGYSVSRKIGVPLIRVGFPIHDRIGGQRILHVGYRGAQQLFDRIVNTMIEVRQSSTEIGYSYM
jgi:nitrogenase molybdenum-iron protein NifN